MRIAAVFNGTLEEEHSLIVALELSYRCLTDQHHKHFSLCPDGHEELSMTSSHIVWQPIHSDGVAN